MVSGGMRSFNSPVPNIFPPPESMRPTLLGQNYMVTAGHPLVAKVASEVLESNGNAIDAGVAAGLASNVIQSDMCNLGGVAPIMMRQANSKKVWSISGVGTWSNSVTIDKYLKKHKSDIPIGAPSCVIPAAFDAWISALSKFGTKSFSEISQYAIFYAEKGYPLDLRTANSFKLMGESFKSWESSKKIYWPDGRPPKTGEILKQADLAKLLKFLSSSETGKSRKAALEKTRKAFYSGKVAKKIVNWVKSGGGWMTIEDLENFRNEVYLAPSYKFEGWDVYTGDIYCQGPVILQSLSILKGFDLKSLDHNSPDYIHLVTEAMKLAFSDREKYYGDNIVDKCQLRDLLSQKHVKNLRSMINPQASLEDLPTLKNPPIRKKDTTYFSIIDKYGNAFSCSPSDTIDGNPIVDGLGIIVSPRGVQSRLDPKHPACIGPNRRPRLTPSPSIALKTNSDKEPKIMTLGSSGGDVIPQGMLQSFLNYVVFKMTPQQSVEAPRFTSLSFPDSFYPNFHDNGRLSIESRIDKKTINTLSKMGHKIHLWPDYEFDSSGVAMSVDIQWPKKNKRIIASGVDVRRSQYAWGH